VKRLWHPAGSLRLRLLAATLVTLTLALAGAQLLLSRLFREHVLQQHDLGLVQQLDQLSARLDFDAQGRPQVDPRSMSDPRWQQPYSGLYWQVEAIGRAGGAAAGAPTPLRSRSLWDTELHLPALAGDAPPARGADADAGVGAVQFLMLTGPRGEPLRAALRSLDAPDQAEGRWRLVVAGDLQAARAAGDHFNGVLAASLAGLGLLLALAALAQVRVGLAPLRTMQRGLQQVRQGRQQRLQGHFPAEVQPLIDDFNGVLDRHAEGVERARAQAGNLAHALKTPLAILGEAARKAGPGELPALVGEQIEAAQRHIQWHLARARAAATQHLPGQRTALRPLVDDLLRVMDKLHAARHLDLSADGVPADLAFAGEAQDLQEMLGNLIDNACRSARSMVAVEARREGASLLLQVDDDGPGIPPAQRAAVLQRGVRLDESRDGSGLGLAIALDLARLYGGTLSLAASAPGGLSARLLLPAIG
jgi:signal transduction histidine kinase